MSNLIKPHQYDTESDEDTPKRKKKPKIPKLPHDMVIIENSEKDTGWMEKWKSGQHPGHIIHPFKLLALGGTGLGKTNSMKNIFLRHQSSDNPFKLLYIITCSEDSTEWLDTEPTEQFVEIPDLDMFDGEDKTCVIIDDFETAKISKEQFRKLSTLMRYICTHRNVSVMLGYQSFFDTPSICRKVANCFMIYKPTGKLERDTIANRLGMDKDQLKNIFKTKITGHHDHLLIDRTVNTPYPYRKNISELISYESDSD
jgi:hypothetical protein